MDCCSPIPDTWFFMTLSLGSPRGLSLPSSRADSEEAGRRTRLCFSHHGDKKLSQIFAYDFTGEAKQGRLDWKEEHLQKHIWKQQPKECWTLIQGLAGKGAFFYHALPYLLSLDQEIHNTNIPFQTSDCLRQTLSFLS